jgi:hypothetical protein
VEQCVAEAPAHDGAGHGGENEKHEIVRPQVLARLGRGVSSDGGHLPRDPSGNEKGGQDAGGEHDRLEADSAVAEAEQRVELERDEGERHGGECTEWQT